MRDFSDKGALRGAFIMAAMVSCFPALTGGFFYAQQEAVMPVYPLTTEWSEPIQLEARDMIQNHSGYPIEVTATDPDADPARLLLPPYGGALQIEGEVTIRARTKRYSNKRHVVRGF